MSSAAIAVESGCGSEVAPRKATAVRVMAVKEVSTARESRYSANILPATRVDLSFKIGGYIEWIAEVKGDGGRMRIISEGDHVEKGDLLARVRAGEVTEKLGEVTALGSGAAAQRDAARQEFERARSLYERSAISKSQFDAARAAYQAATAQVEATSAGAKQVRAAIADTTLRSPISGTLLKRLVEVGSLVGPGVPGFIVADTRTVKASFGVPDTYLEALKPGNPTSLTIEAIPGKVFSGVVSRVAPSADPTTRIFEIETTIPNANDQLKIGMVASVHIGDEKAAVREILLPLSAIVRSPKRKEAFATFVVKEDGGKKLASIRELELGEIDGNQVPAKGGLASGELVVVMGAGLLSDGEEVRLIPDEGADHASKE